MTQKKNQLLPAIAVKTNVASTIPLFASRPAAGFPAPGDDLVERPLDLNDLLIDNPTSTFFVNIIGCFCIGIVAGLLSKYKVNELYALLLITGILGGFTTFSSFALEFVQLWKNNQITLALLYVVFTNFVGIAFAAFGLYCIK